ncbi:hypothetical protein C0992_002521 [Termitomyces sp. T32_za158]|nr:hypothetical protein C0992_002521 [Termitomyces sp. T32_za158]
MFYPPNNFPSDPDLDAVHDFFKSSLPTLLPGPRHTSSRLTRDPAGFDQHLDDHLRLRHVVYCPSLIDDFAALADDAVSKYLQVKGPLPSTSPVYILDQRTKRYTDANEFPGWEKRARAIFSDKKIDNIRNEASIEQIYSTTLAQQCVIVASTLEFRLSKWSQGFLRWDLNNETEYKPYARADGFFKMVDSFASGPPGSHSPKLLSPFHAGLMSSYPTLAPWEFKNLLAGNLAVFQCIRELSVSRTFPWIDCEHKQSCHTIRRKGHPPPNKDGIAHVFWEPLGYDAPEPVCQSVLGNPVPLNQIPRISEHFERDDHLHAIYIMQQVILFTLFIELAFMLVAI